MDTIMKTFDTISIPGNDVHSLVTDTPKYGGNHAVKCGVQVHGWTDSSKNRPVTCPACLAKMNEVAR